MVRERAFNCTRQPSIAAFLTFFHLSTPTTMSDIDQQKNQVAQEKYGKDFDELEGRERQSVGGTVGGSKGGNARKEQLAAEHGGDASKGYAEMGQKGGSVTNEDTGNA